MRIWSTVLADAVAAALVGRGMDVDDERERQPREPEPHRVALRVQPPGLSMEQWRAASCRTAQVKSAFSRGHWLRPAGSTLARGAIRWAAAGT